MEEIDHIAINRKPGVNNLRRLGFVLTRWPHPKLMRQKIQNIRNAASVQETLQQFYGIEIKAQTNHVEHHLAHLASAYLVSGFKEAACISIDGFGDFASTAFGMGEGQSVKIDKRVFFPHSLGIFYSALTQYLGFPNYGDEYKVMGLAPYGEPNYLDQVVRIRPDGTFRLNLNYFRHHTPGKIARRRLKRYIASHLSIFSARHGDRTSQSSKNTKTSRARSRLRTRRRFSPSSKCFTKSIRAIISRSPGVAR